MKLTSVGASLLATFLILFGSTVTVRAAEPVDLGDGLSYLRVTSVEDSAKNLTAALRERDALVLDLRYPTAHSEAATVLQTALQERKRPGRIFVLVSPATPPALADVLRTVPTKTIILGVRDSLPTPHVIVDQPAATDRLAYEALGPDHSLASLITGKIDKPRYDEAALMKEFADGSPEPAPTTDSSTKSTEPATVKLSDRVLQRAVHLHRALLAIKQH